MRILTTGGREYDGARIQVVMDKLLEKYGPDMVIIHGACRTGADAQVDAWCRAHHVTVERYAADWDRYGPLAGPLRNSLMVAASGATLCLAFPGGKGTRDCMKKARRAGIPVVEVE